MSSTSGDETDDVCVTPRDALAGNVKSNDHHRLMEVIEDQEACLLFRMHLRECNRSPLLSFWFEVESYRRKVVDTASREQLVRAPPAERPVYITGSSARGEDMRQLKGSGPTVCFTSPSPDPPSAMTDGERDPVKVQLPLLLRSTAPTFGTLRSMEYGRAQQQKGGKVAKKRTWSPYELEDGYKDAKRKASDIYGKYVSSSAPYSLDLPKEIKQSVRKEVNKIKKGKEPSPSLFDLAQRSVMNMMDEHLETFIASKAYQCLKGGSLRKRDDLLDKPKLLKRSSSMEAITAFHYRQAKKHKVFGVPLEILQERRLRTSGDDSPLPYVARRLIEFLMAEGLDKKDLVHAEVPLDLLKRAKQIYNTGKDQSFFALRETPELAFALLRLFLQKLPHSLIPDEYYHDFIATAAFTVHRKKLSHLRAVMKELPVCNRELLQAILFLCHSLTLHSSINGISAEDLAKILNPNIVWKDIDKTSVSSIEAVHHVLTLLVDHYHEVFRSATPYGKTTLGTFYQKRIFHRKSVQCLLVLPSTIWSADSSGLVNIWNKVDGNLLSSFNAGGVIVCMHEHNGTAYCSNIENVQLRTVEDGTLVGSTSIYGVVCFCSLDDVVLGGGVGGVSMIRYLDGKVSHQAMPTNTVYDVRSLLYLRSCVWAGCSDGFIRTFDISSWGRLQEVKAHEQSVTDVVVGPNGRVWSSSDDGSLCVFDPENNEVVHMSVPHSGRLLGLATFENTVWSYGWDSVIKVWDATTLALVDEMTGWHHDAVSGVVFCFSAGERRKQAWSCSFDRSICIILLNSSLFECRRSRLSSISSPSEGMTRIQSYLVLNPRVPKADGETEANDTEDGTERTEMISIQRQDASELELDTPETDEECTTRFRPARPSSDADRHVPFRCSDGSAATSTTAGGALAVPADSAQPRTPRTGRFYELMKVADAGDIQIMFDRPLGRGCLGTTYQGVCHSQTVAVKLIHERKFDDHQMGVLVEKLSEMQSVVHPSLVLYMGASHHTRGLMLVYQYMAKGSFLDVLMADPKKSTLKRMTLAKQFAMCLRDLHANEPPIIHEGLRLSNVLIDEDNNVKVSDLGLASLFREMDFAATDRRKKKDSFERLPWTTAPETLTGLGPITTKADIYSFGVILLLMYTAKVPSMIGCSTYEDVVEMVGRRQKRLKIPESAPDSLRTIIELCLEHKPVNRPSLDEVLLSFDEAILSAVVQDDMGRRMWQKAYGCKTSASWVKFLSVFKRGLSLDVPKDDVRIACLHALLCSEEGEVSLQSFADMLQYFGPLSEPGILDRIKNVLHHPWFHGSITLEVAEQRLLGAVKKKSSAKKGTFLVRFSRSEPGSYALSVFEGTSIKHYRITRNAKMQHCIGNGRFSELEELVRRCKNAINLKTPCEGSQYELLFKPMLFNESAGYEQFSPAEQKKFFRL